MFKFKIITTVRHTLPLIPFKMLPLTSNTLSLLTLEAVLKSSFVSIFTRCDQQCGECCCQAPSIRKAGLWKHARVSLFTLFTTSVTVWLPALPQSQNEWIQDIEAASTTQLKTLTEEAFQDWFRKLQGISVFLLKEKVLRGIKGNVFYI